MTERMVYRLFFLGRNFVSSLISTLNIKDRKPQKTCKNLLKTQNLETFLKYLGFPALVCVVVAREVWRNVFSVASVSDGGVQQLRGCGRIEQVSADTGKHRHRTVNDRDPRRNEWKNHQKFLDDWRRQRPGRNARLRQSFRRRLLVRSLLFQRCIRYGGRRQVRMEK